jgi:drug/metabolite transporter (DMT)-like permease
VLWTAIIATLFCWSFNYVAAKTALRHIDAFSLAVLRLPLATLLILPIYFSQRNRTRPRLSDLWTFTYLGIFGSLLNQIFFTVGLSHTTSERSVLFFALSPILILLLARAMKLEALTPGKILGMAISFLGVILLEAERGSPIHSPFLLGDLMTLGSSLSFCVYAVLGKRVATKYDALSMNTFNLVAASIMALPFSIHQAIHLDWKSVGWAGWAGMFYMAAFSAVLAYTLFYWVLRYMEASRVAAVNYFQPVIVLLLAGGALVLLGVYLAERVSS